MKSIVICLFLGIAFSVHPQVERIQTENNSLQFTNLFDATQKAHVACYRIPSMVTAPNGAVLAAIDERIPSCADLRSNRDINIVMRRSLDNGVSWSTIETVVDYPEGKSASDPSMIVDKITGAIFMFFNYMDLDKEKEVYYFKVVKSLDNGKTWSTPIDITSQVSKPEWHQDFKFITAGRGIQTANGALLHTIVNLDKGLHLFGSEDHGDSWHFIDTPITPADESKIVELMDGSWMINSRVNGLGTRYVHTSIDKGKSWKSRPDASLIDAGCNASIIRYTSVQNGDDKNRLLFSNANSKNNRSNLTVRISYDEGETWSAGKTIYSQGAAYSSMNVLSNGAIGLFFEKDDYQENVFVELTLDLLTDGVDTYVLPEQK
ncbi:MAG: sialidase-1 [Maribacter sp.]|jgi:sialidase-1